MLINCHLLPFRPDYCDAADFGQGFIARNTWTGRIDAPDFMPQGSMTWRGAAIGYPSPSMASRDTLSGCEDAGVHHSGPERAFSL